MKRHITLLLAALLIAATLLSACQQQGQPIPSDPVEAVKLILDKQKDIKSQHTDLTADLTLKLEGLPSDDSTAAIFKNFKANLTAGGDADNAKQDFSLKGTADLGVLTSFLSQGADQLEFEAIKVGDTMYSRLAEQEWSETPIETTSGDNAAPADLAKVQSQINDILKKVAKAERLGDEAIDGVDSYHFKVALDPVEMINEVAKLRLGGDVDQAQVDQARELLKDSQFNLEMWVGKADLFIRQEKFNVTVNLKNIPDAPADATVFMQLNVTVKASKLNQPVTISKP